MCTQCVLHQLLRYTLHILQNTQQLLGNSLWPFLHGQVTFWKGQLGFFKRSRLESPASWTYTCLVLFLSHPLYEHCRILNFKYWNFTFPPPNPALSLIALDSQGFLKKHESRAHPFRLAGNVEDDIAGLGGGVLPENCRGAQVKFSTDPWPLKIDPS